MIRIINYILKPLRSEYVFFLCFVFLISQTAFKTLIVNWKDVNSDIPTLGYLCLSAFISYLATVVLYLTKSKALKVLFYTFGISLFAVYMFLWLVFGTSLSPTIIQIVGETNAGETSEFLNAFLLSKKSIISIISVLVVVAIIILLERKAKTLKASLAVEKLMGGGDNCYSSCWYLQEPYLCHIIEDFYFCRISQMVW